MAISLFKNNFQAAKNYQKGYLVWHEPANKLVIHPQKQPQKEVQSFNPGYT